MSNKITIDSNFVSLHMKVDVYKFGGSSIANTERIRNVGKILKESKCKTLVVVSALGKMTNKFETIVKEHYDGSKALNILEEIKGNHYLLCEELLQNPEPTKTKINDLAIEIEWILEDEKQPSYDYSYDQIVSMGEMFSTTIVADYLVELGLNVRWIDVRGVIMTNNRYRDADVDWEITGNNIKSVKTKFDEADIIITQGFIGSTSENDTTTLGREGSDYTAAIFSYWLDAETMTVWKDVRGVLNCDPARFEDTRLIEKVSYKEAIEMAYYGAKIIHPKTIKPLQNKNIPLHVRSFIDIENEGTLVSSLDAVEYPPVVSIHDDQMLLKISSLNFSFIEESQISEIFTGISDARMKVRLVRNTAISLGVCSDDSMTKVKELESKLGEQYKIDVERELQLVTIRYFDAPTYKVLTEGKEIILEERLKDTLRFIART